MSEDRSTYWRESHPKCPHCKQVQQDYADHVEDWDGQGGPWALKCEDCREVFYVVTGTTVHFSSAISEEAADDEEWGPQKANAP